MVTYKLYFEYEDRIVDYIGPAWEKIALIVRMLCISNFSLTAYETS